MTSSLRFIVIHNLHKITFLYTANLTHGAGWLLDLCCILLISRMQKMARTEKLWQSLPIPQFHQSSLLQRQNQKDHLKNNVSARVHIKAYSFWLTLRYFVTLIRWTQLKKYVIWMYVYGHPSKKENQAYVSP